MPIDEASSINGPSHPEFAELLDIVFPLAEEELRRSGSFLPFGGGITGDTQIELLQPTEDNWEPGDPPLLEQLTERLRERAARGELQASVLCFHARVEDVEGDLATDAICAQLENALGTAIDVFYPYQAGPGRSYEFGESFAWEGVRRIFPVGEPPAPSG